MGDYWWIAPAIYMVIAFVVAALIPGRHDKKLYVLYDKLFYLFTAFVTTIIVWIIGGFLK